MQPSHVAHLKVFLEIALVSVVGSLLGAGIWLSYLWLSPGPVSGADYSYRFKRSQIGLEEAYFYDFTMRNMGKQDLWTLSASPYSAMKLFAIFPIDIDDPTADLGQGITCDVITGKSGPYSYAVRIRVWMSKHYPLALKYDQFLRVSVLTPKGREKRFEDLNWDGMFDVRREIFAEEVTQLDLFYNGDWVNVNAGAWNDGENIGPLIISGANDALAWDGNRWVIEQ